MLSFLDSLIVFIYGILTPLYYNLLKGKLTNEKAFLITWYTAPFLISYFYTKLGIIPIIIFFHLFCYILIIYNKFKYIKSGYILIALSIIMILFNKLFLH
jgi:hypothetical protein